MDAKFMGVGLKNALGLYLLFMIFSVTLKVIVTKHEIPGFSEVVRTA